MKNYMVFDKEGNCTTIYSLPDGYDISGLPEETEEVKIKEGQSSKIVPQRFKKNSSGEIIESEIFVEELATIPSEGISPRGKQVMGSKEMYSSDLLGRVLELEKQVALLNNKLDNKE